jgi:hypothetical protein
MAVMVMLPADLLRDCDAVMGVWLEKEVNGGICEAIGGDGDAVNSSGASNEVVSDAYTVAIAGPAHAPTLGTERND